MLLAILCCFAFLAGFVDAMVGCGGLIQLPAFFIFQPHLSLVQTLATNKTSNFFGTTVAAYRYSKRVEIDWKHLAVAMVTAVGGSLAGAFLVSRLHKEQFMPFIIVVLVFLLIYTLYKKELGLHRVEKALSKNKYYLYALLTGGIMGFYDGLIGPGTGSLLIFAFVVVFGNNFLDASANAKVINCVTSIAALSFFIIRGDVIWSIALPLGAANMVGNYAGTHLALKKGSKFIRTFFIIVVVALIVKLGYDYIKAH